MSSSDGPANVATVLAAELAPSATRLPALAAALQEGADMAECKRSRGAADIIRKEANRLDLKIWIGIHLGNGGPFVVHHSCNYGQAGTRLTSTEACRI